VPLPEPQRPDPPRDVTSAEGDRGERAG